MPRGDGTGPMGFGMMSGRGAGYCAGFRVPGFANLRAVGRGAWRMHWGPVRYRRWRYAAPLGMYPDAGPSGWSGPYRVEPGDEAAMLREQADALKAHLRSIEKRLEDLDKDEE